MSGTAHSRSAVNGPKRLSYWQMLAAQRTLHSGEGVLHGLQECACYEGSCSYSFRLRFATRQHCCRDDDGTPVTARRWLSLVSRGGDDDMFSSDFNAEELQARMLRG